MGKVGQGKARQESMICRDAAVNAPKFGDRIENIEVLYFRRRDTGGSQLSFNYSPKNVRPYEAALARYLQTEPEKVL